VKITLNIPGLSRARLKVLSDFYGEPPEVILAGAALECVRSVEEWIIDEARAEDAEMLEKIIPMPRP
jgi:hypothetical protein